jgi:hypothetical protein
VARASGIAQRGNLLVTLAVFVLAVCVLLLVIYALRAPQIAESGESPGPAPTWTPLRTGIPSTPPPNSPSASVPGEAASKTSLSIFNSQLAVRSTQGVCDQSLPAPAVAGLSLTSDGGATWDSVDLEPLEVREILSIDYVTDSEIDVVARIGPSCQLTLLVSFTGGEFWASYPDRLPSAVYYDNSSPGAINFRGVAVSVPCPTIEDVSSFDSGVLARCSDGIYLFDANSAEWRLLSLVSATSAAVASDRTVVLISLTSAPNCDGVGIRRFDLSAIPQDGVDVACLAREQAEPNTALAVEGATSLLWSESGLFGSNDQGASWTTRG